MSQWDTDELVRIIINDSILYREARAQIQASLTPFAFDGLADLVRAYAETEDQEIRDIIKSASDLGMKLEPVKEEFKAWIIENLDLPEKSDAVYDLSDLEGADMLEVITDIIA